MKVSEHEQTNPNAGREQDNRAVPQAAAVGWASSRDSNSKTLSCRSQQRENSLSDAEKAASEVRVVNGMVKNRRACNV